MLSGGVAMILDAKRTNPKEGGPSFGFGHRLYRSVWNIAWALFAAWTPIPLHRWRVLLARLFGGEIDWTAHIYPSARIWYPANLSMGAHACLAERVNCYTMAPIRIGSGAVVSQGAYLCSGTHDIRDPSFQLVALPIVIGCEAWVAAESFVGPGVTIGEGAVLGARGVTLRDLEAYTVYVGNPAAAVGKREMKDAAG